MNNACPECGAVYAVAEKDIGRRIACKKCNSALIVAEEGLVRDDDALPPRKEDSAERIRDRGEEERPRKRDDEERVGRRRRDRENEETEERPRAPRDLAMGSYLTKLKTVADVPTWLYAIGLFLTVYGFFGPSFDHATTMKRQGAYVSERLDFDIYKRSIVDKPDGKTPTSDETKRLEEREKEWSKKTEPALKDDISFAEAAEKKAQWWNVLFKMLGFFLLAFGSIGYLKDEMNLKRVLGGVTILLILLQVIGGSAGIALQAGGGPR